MVGERKHDFIMTIHHITDIFLHEEYKLN